MSKHSMGGAFGSSSNGDGPGSRPSRRTRRADVAGELAGEDAKAVPAGDSQAHTGVEAASARLRAERGRRRRGKVANSDRRPDGW